MQHNYTLEGNSYILRPVKKSDASFIASLRSDQDLTKFINKVTSNVADQEAWLESYFLRPDDYYFVVERKSDKRQEGLISLYDVDENKGVGEWGRWILRKDSSAAVESAYLIYMFAFETLSLNKTVCRTILENKKVCSFHDSCGLARQRTLPRYLEDHFDAVEHVLTKPEWLQKTKPMLEPVVKRGIA